MCLYSQLSGCVIEQVNKRCKFLLQFVSNDIPAVVGSLDESSHPFGHQPVDAGALGWAMSAVSSRAFRIRGSQQSATTSRSRKLLPLIDMCNHSFRPNARLVQHGAEDEGDFTLHVRGAFLALFYRLLILQWPHVFVL